MAHNSSGDAAEANGTAFTAASPEELVADLRARLDILEASAAVTESAGLDLDAVLEAVCGRATAALSAGGAGVYLRDDDGVLELARLDGWERFDSSWGAEAIDEQLGGRLQVVDDPERLRALGGPWTPEQGTAAVALAPLRLGERDLGGLVVARRVGEGRSIEPRARHVLAAIAQQAALAISNACLYARERTTVRRLKALAELKADHVAGLSHDLRSPLAGMLAFVQTMRRVDATASADERLEYLDIMERQVTRLIGLVEDMLLGARLEAGSLQPDQHEAHDLAELVGSLLSTLAPAHRSRVRMDLAGPVVVRIDRRQIERVVQNLVDNALVHTPTSTTVTVEVRAGKAPDAAELVVHDDGPGIAPETMASLFSRYGRAEGSPPGSTGLGL